MSTVVLVLLTREDKPNNNLPMVSIVSLSSIRSCALGMSMCILSVCCCLLSVSDVRVFLLETKERQTVRFSLTEKILANLLTISLPSSN